jgi:glutathione reductase (NADPH)
MRSKGVEPGTLAIDWPALMRVKRADTDPLPQKFIEGYIRQGIEVSQGTARFVRPTELEVSSERLQGRHVLIAAGARPTRLPFPGVEHLATSDDFVELDRLPPRIVFVGGGYISMEFAHLAARASAQVTVIHRGARPLEAFDHDLVDLLVRRTRDLGIRVELETEVAGVEPLGNGLVVHGHGFAGKGRFEADLAVHGAGRVPDLDDLDLPRAGVTREHRGRRC